MRNKFHLILALACALCFTTSLSAQDTEKPEKPKAAKKAKGAKAKQSPMMRAFGAAELTDAQKKQMKELVAAKKEEMAAIRTSMSELVSKEDAKTIKMAVRKAIKGGSDKAAAQKAAWDEVGLSAEDQATLSELQKKRMEIEKGITDEIVATFSDEQKAAMKAGKKGKAGKEKKPKGEKKEKDLTSVSVSLPAMT